VRRRSPQLAGASLGLIVIWQKRLQVQTTKGSVDKRIAVRYPPLEDDEFKGLRCCRYTAKSEREAGIFLRRLDQAALGAARLSRAFDFLEELDNCRTGSCQKLVNALVARGLLR
jgi:hypothetical protein